MRSQIPRLLATLALLATNSACNGDGGVIPPAQTAPQPGSAATKTVTIPQGAVGLGTTAFGENPLTIAPGTTVTWVNQDGMGHTTTSDDGYWDSGFLAPGQSFSFQFTGGGTFPYRCNIHGAASMSGTIIVSGPPNPSFSPQPTTLSPTFTVVRDKILNPHCMECHEPPDLSAGLDFSTWQSLVHNPVLPSLVVPGSPDSSALWVHISSGVMNGGQEAMTAQERQTVFNWIQAGAPND